jgi:hypothetical protein
MPIRVRFLVGIGTIVLAGCNSETTTAHASVRCEFVAPYCSGPFPVQLLVDNAQLGVDTFVVNHQPNHTTSKTFQVASGAHTISAHVTGGFVFPDRSVTLAPDSVFVDSLSYYCS